VQKSWSQNQLAEALQRVGLDKSRQAVARIEAQIVYVSDFQLLFIARVLGVGLLELYPTIGPEDDLYDTVTELRKPRKYAAPNRWRRKTNRVKKGRLHSERPVTVPTTATARMTAVTYGRHETRAL
jgi:transcriptional regulator with XRE-family HTH domain